MGHNFRGKYRLSNAKKDDLLVRNILSSLRVARPGAPDRIFCLGANVGRISFASQQTRALNLIWALGKQGLLNSDKLVAVVGGGVSGITAATAVRGFGCSVRVFEEGGSELYRQRWTTHRHVHPTVNWWPKAELLPTTALPFMNWGFANCHEVIEVMYRTWSNMEKKSNGSVTIQFGQSIQNLFIDEANGGRVTLQTKDGRNTPAFDLVIVATGFGEEEGNAENSYWKADGIEQRRDDPSGKRHFIISGTGDGGLIDALRLCYNFSFGGLAFRFAEATTNTDIADRVEAIEDSRDGAGSDWTARSLEYEAIARDILRSPSDSSLSDAYRTAHDILEADVLSHRKGLVTLAMRDSASPYEGMAAPVHKLLIAYAKLHAVLSYKKGTLDSIVKYSVDGKKATIGTLTTDNEALSIIVRHGAPRYREGILSEDEWKNIADNQLRMSEYSHESYWSGEVLPVPEPLLCAYRDPGGYMTSLLNPAQKVFVQLGSSASVSATSEAFVVRGHDLKYRPREMFGRPVHYSDGTDAWGEAHAL